MRCVVRDCVKVAFVSSENMFACDKPCGIVERTSRNADSVFVVHAIKQAGPAAVTEPALGPVGRCKPRQPILVGEHNLVEYRPRRRPMMPTQPATLAAVAHGNFGSQVFDLKGHGPTFTMPLVHHALPIVGWLAPKRTP